MSKILDLITDPSWWVSAVIVGIVVGIISSYAKERIDGFVGQLSASARKKKDKREIEITHMASALKGRVEERMHLQFMHRNQTINLGIALLAPLSLVLLITINAFSGNWWIVLVLTCIAAWCMWDIPKQVRTIRFIEEVLWRSLKDSPFWEESRKPEGTPQLPEEVKVPLSSANQPPLPPAPPPA